MRCFNVDSLKVTDGLKIFRDAERPYVRIKTNHECDLSDLTATLSPEVAKLLPAGDGLFEHSSQLLRCDVTRRGQMWLGPESDTTKFQALILFQAAWHSSDDRAQMAWSIAFEGPPGEVFDRSRCFIPTSKSGGTTHVHCFAALIRVPTGSAFIVRGAEVGTPPPIRRWAGAKSRLGLANWFVKFSEGRVTSHYTDRGWEHPKEEPSAVLAKHSREAAT